jgi:hypothetical protein
MKTRSLKEKKLVLNKISIARLDNERLDQVKGGVFKGALTGDSFPSCIFGGSVTCPSLDGPTCVSIDQMCY